MTTEDLKLIVGCPVSHREWIIPRWFVHVEAACEVAEIPMGEVAFMFVGDRRRDPTFAAIKEAAPKGSDVFVCHIEDVRPRDSRVWNMKRYTRMVALRNLLLNGVRHFDPELFLSLDSDILLHEEHLRAIRDAIGRFDAVGGKCYLSLTGLKQPSWGKLDRENKLVRQDAIGCFPVQIIMAIKLMSRPAYQVDYEFHKHGEDTGWSVAAARAGLDLGWNGEYTSKHVWGPNFLDTVDRRLGLVMGLDVVVVNYRTPADLAKFVQSFVEHLPAIPTTLTVVDVEAADENRVEPMNELAVPAELVLLKENVGYGRACNMAAARGGNEVIALFNADVILRAGVLEHCHAALVAEPTWGVLGPRQINEQQRLVHAGIFGTNRTPRHRGWMERDHGQYTAVEPAVTVAGSAYFVKRSLWWELTRCPVFVEISDYANGAFLPTRHFYEETWCSYHARAHGRQVMYDGRVTITHKLFGALKDKGAQAVLARESQAYFREACRAHGLECD